MGRCSEMSEKEKKVPAVTPAEALAAAFKLKETKEKPKPD